MINNLGSHKSFTYRGPKKWWAWILWIFQRTQNKNIFEQYDSGVRLFELGIRVGMDSEKDPRIFYGNLELDISWQYIKSILSLLNYKQEKVYVRVTLEETVSSIFEKTHELNFKKVCKYLQENFKDIKFIGGIRKYDGVKLYDFGTELHIYNGFPNYPYWPWLYRWTRKKKNISKFQNDWNENYKWYLSDFITKEDENKKTSDPT